MQFHLPIEIRETGVRISYKHSVMLIGSCFTEHIGGFMKEHKFRMMQNPNGILFDPFSICNSIESYINGKIYTSVDLFRLNDVWNTWDHHSRFSDINDTACLEGINSSQQAAHDFLKKADWLIITLGTSFSYKLTNEAGNFGSAGNREEGYGVANCHRAPANWFRKTLLPIPDIISMLDNTYHQLRQFNPSLKIIFTISPVRHIRDGVVENNRSKARLIEAVHHMIGKFDGLYYFPAYEIVVDVLRDYRFYDADLVHPNYAATEFVMEKFKSTFIEKETILLMDEIRKIMIARNHKPMHPGTNAHKSFLQTSLERAIEIQDHHPLVDLGDEINYFQSSLKTL